MSKIMGNLRFFQFRNYSAVKNFEALGTLKYPNGTKAQPLFSKNEYENRVGKLRSKMAENGLDAAIFTSMHNIGKVSHYHSQTNR